jgi:hypothetical protein
MTVWSWPIEDNGNVARMGRDEVHTGFGGGNQYNGDHLEDLDVDNRILLKCILTKSFGGSWTKLSVWHIPLMCVQWKTPDDGQRNCPKHVEFHFKNKFEKLMHLVGFIIRHFTRCTSKVQYVLVCCVAVGLHCSAGSMHVCVCVCVCVLCAPRHIGEC